MDFWFAGCRRSAIAVYGLVPAQKTYTNYVIVPVVHCVADTAEYYNIKIIIIYE